MNPLTKDASYFGYSQDFTRELCVTNEMPGINGTASYYIDCNGFQMVVTKEASNGADEIKVIHHEEMDDVEIEDEDIEEGGKEELENNVEGYCIHFRYFNSNGT